MPDNNLPSPSLLQQYLAAPDQAAFLRSLTDAQLGELAEETSRVIIDIIDLVTDVDNEPTTQPGGNVV